MLPQPAPHVLTRTRLSAASLCTLGLMCSSALAQSSYTASTLSQPYLDAYEADRAFSIDSGNRVHGNRSIFSLSEAFARFTMGGGWNGNVPRAATWAAGTGTSVSAVNVAVSGTARPQTLATSSNGSWELLRINGSKPSYRVINNGKAQDITTPSSAVMLVPRVINNNGTVGGYGTDSEIGYVFAFTWKAGVLTRLPTGPRPEGGTITAINNQDVAVGFVQVSDTLFMPVRWTQGQIELPTKDLPSPYGEAIKINDQGDIVIALRDTPLGQSPYGVLRNGQFTSLPATAGVSAITGFNNAGAVVGSDGKERAKLWKDGTEYDLTDLVKAKGAKLPATAVLSRVFGINDSGSLVADYFLSDKVTGRTVVRLTATP